MDPLVGFIIPANKFKRVVFPHPEGPNITTYSLSLICSSASVTAFTFPKFLDKDLISIVGSLKLSYIMFHFFRKNNHIIRFITYI